MMYTIVKGAATEYIKDLHNCITVVIIAPVDFRQILQSNSVIIVNNYKTAFFIVFFAL